MSHKRLLRPWGSAWRFVLPWFVPALFCVLVKLYLMATGKGFRVVARFLGRVEGTGYTGLSFWERLTFFRGEILIGFLLIPLVLLLLFRYLPRFLCAFLSATLSVGVAFALLVQIRALEEMGQFISLRLFVVGLTWGVYNPAANKGYLLTREFLIFVVGLIAIAWLVWRAVRRDRQVAAFISDPQWRWRALAYASLDMTLPGRTVRLDPETAAVASELTRRWMILAYAGIAVVFTGLAWRPLLPATPYHKDVLGRVLSSLWQESNVDSREFTGLSAQELVSRYRELTHAPVRERDPRYFGKQRGANVIMFVLETTPERFLPSGDPLEDFPNLKRLERNSFNATQHYTTYPYTNRALFSLFSSWYPSDGVETFSEERPGRVLPGLAKALSAEGYATAMYLPSPLHGEADLSTFEAFGFDRQVFPDPASLAAFAPKDVEPAWKAERIARDTALLGLLKRDVEGWLAQRRPFAAVFIPQVGHIPWPDTEPAGGDPQILKRGRAVVAMQVAWLGQLIEMLEQHQQLENTVIVVTGDHGIRTRHEDPGFAGGTIDEYSFHVPLRIFAPKAVAAPERIPWLTSHLDVTPTLLDLLGVEKSRDFEQGTPIWTPALAGRTTFFLARQAFGADAYHSGGQFFMWSQLSDAVYASGQAHFTLQGIVPADSQQARDAVRTFARFAGLEEVWTSQLGQAESSHAATADAPNR
ncbi:MAG: sulfatase-like hydrolase/transferase [Candidatus Acidiferrales bacterium]